MPIRKVKNLNRRNLALISSNLFEVSPGSLGAVNIVCNSPVSRVVDARLSGDESVDLCSRHIPFLGEGWGRGNGCDGRVGGVEVGSNLVSGP